jgi:hypothetical protein
LVFISWDILHYWSMAFECIGWGDFQSYNLMLTSNLNFHTLIWPWILKLIFYSSLAETPFDAKSWPMSAYDDCISILITSCWLQNSYSKVWFCLEFRISFLLFFSNDTFRGRSIICECIGWVDFWSNNMMLTLKLNFQTLIWPLLFIVSLTETPFGLWVH